MIPYQKEKFENAICFFASEHYKATRKALTQTYLYKYLALLDFRSIETTGKPVLGLEYMAMEKGPVPIKLYRERETIKSDCFEFKKSEGSVYQVVNDGKNDYLPVFLIGTETDINKICMINVSNFRNCCC